MANGAGRARTTQPEFFQHYNLWLLEQLTGMPMRVAFQAVWRLSDREGRFEWKPELLKVNGLPYDRCDPGKVLEALRVTGYVGKYLSADRARAFGFVLNWHHQHINPREQASRIPAPPAEAITLASNQHTLSDLDLSGLVDRAGLTRDPKSPDASLTREEIKQASQNGQVIQTAPEALPEGVDASATREGRDLDALSRARDVVVVRGGSGNRESLEKQQQQPEHLGDYHQSTQLDRAGGDLAGSQLPAAEESQQGMRVAPVAKSAALPPIRGARTHDAIMARLASVSVEIQTGVRESLAREQMRRLAAELVFSYWTVRFGHPKAKLDEKREERIVKRLLENQDDVSELLYALDGAYHDDHIMGRKGGPVYDGIETVLRERSQVERFANTRKGYRDGKPHAAYEKYLAALRGEVSDLAEEDDQPAGADSSDTAAAAAVHDLEPHTVRQEVEEDARR